MILCCMRIMLFFLWIKFSLIKGFFIVVSGCVFVFVPLKIFHAVNCCTLNIYI